MQDRIATSIEPRANPVQVTMPLAPTANSYVTFSNGSTGPLSGFTVNGNGNRIMGSTTFLSVDTPYWVIKLIFNTGETGNWNLGG